MDYVRRKGIAFGADLATAPWRVNVRSLCEQHEAERKTTSDQAVFDRHIVR